MIEEYRFGEMVINGLLYTRDLKILEGAVVPDWWRKKGHRVYPEDILDILEKTPDTLVLGKGQPGKMASTSALQKALRENGIELIEEETATAVDTYNRMSGEGRLVAAGFHLTC